jgi:nucleoside-diphosphate-sugar epimerase
MPTAPVPGGAGFIGSHLVDPLLESRGLDGVVPDDRFGGVALLFGKVSTA